jgi:SanA protein
MIKKILKMFWNLFWYCAFAAVLIFGIPRLVTTLYAAPRTYTLADAPTARAAVVFGAGLLWDGTPTPVLRHRVATAADLYFAGKVEKILMSGDNRFVDYNEPGAMYSYAVELGVPPEDIVFDYAGRRTYDTCYRAKAIFGLDDVLLVTQRFHLPRALFLCGQMGLKSSGVIADRSEYSRTSRVVWNLRETPATLVALVEAWVTHPLPVLGEPEPIFPPRETGRSD